MNKIKKSALSVLNAMKRSIFILIGVILLISLITALIPESFYAKMFMGNSFLDSFIGAVLGSISAGNPITSYVIGGELFELGISMFAITAFILAWVSVGLVQIPAESYLLGKKFALIRNFISFVFAILISIFVGLLL